MESKHFIIFIGVVLIIFMLFSLNKEDTSQSVIDDNTSNVENTYNGESVNNNTVNDYKENETSDETNSAVDNSKKSEKSSYKSINTVKDNDEVQ